MVSTSVIRLNVGISRGKCSEFLFGNCLEERCERHAPSMGGWVEIVHRMCSSKPRQERHRGSLGSR